MNNTFCVKVKLSTNGGNSWQTYTEGNLDCFDANAARIAVTTEGVNRMNVSLCLVQRKDVCSVPVSVKISKFLLNKRKGNMTSDGILFNFILICSYFD